MPILNEVEYQYRTRLWSDIRQYVGKGYYIHFGQTPKIGIRVQGKAHTDPTGVYFYKLDWLVKHPRFIEGEQFATTWPYWTIVKLLPDDHGIIFSRLTWDDLEKLAVRQQWPQFDDWERSRFEQKNYPHNTAAGLFWDYIKACGAAWNSKNLPSQAKVLKGISFIEDDGFGIIHTMEPHQIVVFDPRVVQVVATGNQGRNPKETDPLMDGNRFAFVELLKRLRGQYGGTISWSKKLPTLTFNASGADFALGWTPSSWDAKLRFEAKWGRARKTYSFDKHKFERETMDQVMKFFTDIINKIASLAKAKKDLFFIPAIPEKDALIGIKSLIGTDGFSFTTEIDNDNKQMTVMAEKTLPLGDKGKMLIMVYCMASENVRWAVNIKINHHTVAAARSSDISSVGPTLMDNFNQSLESVHPNSDGYGRKFYYEDEYQAFIGMVAETSGIKSLLNDYKTEIATWRDYKNKKEIIRDTLRIY